MVYNILFALFFIIVFFTLGFNFYRGKYFNPQPADSDSVTTDTAKPSELNAYLNMKSSVSLFIIGICLAIFAVIFGWG